MTLFTDPQSVHNPTSTGVPPSTWGDLVRDDLVYLDARGPKHCTSVTRPASPFAGQVIFETDTSRWYQYRGATWEILPLGYGLPRCKAVNNAAQAINNSTVTPVDFQTETYDVGGCHSSSPSSRFIAPVAGLYHVTCSVLWNNSATAGRIAEMWFEKNTTAPSAFLGHTLVNPNNSGYGANISTTELELAANDYVVALVAQSNGSSAAIQLLSGRCFFTFRLVAGLA